MVEAGRVAEVIAELPDGTTSRGSGYRTGGTAVLTAAHVVATATLVRVRFDADTADEWEAVATRQWVDPRSDLAVLSITAGEIPPVRFGRVGDGDAVLPAKAVGFPLWKLKNYDGTVVTADGRPRYRDTHQADGMVAVLSNRREGTLEFTVTPPERETDPAVSPWEGMSGAALWMGDRIVGVIARHHRAEGLGRLTAVRLTPELLDVLGVTGPLPDAGRPRASDHILTDYRRQVAAIAPERLLDRGDDLADLTRFVAGDEPYAWWQAGPWAGKSALMSWFVLHPPEGVEVVSFFVTGRLAAQDDSDAFTKELTLQLAALTGEHLPDVLTPDGRQNQLWRLLDEAAQRCRRLLVVIDGLDEDAGPSHGKPSIASLLPKRPPPNVRVLIASRPDPQVPDDVLDDDHPLLTCLPRQLADSSHARSMERRAVNELNRHLGGDELHREVLGLITASGGGLTRADLEELTGRPPYEIDRLLDGPLGRTIGSRPAPLRPEEHRPVHLFAHETLAQAARTKFGTSVLAYRDRVHQWADAYREKGWPPETPQYLLLGYPHLLVDAGDHDRLVAVATDRTRHDRMLLTTGGDVLAASEVRLAQDVLACHPASPDLSALLLLAAHKDKLAHRNSVIPAHLPLVWAMLGDTARADALVRGITDDESQARGLTALAGHAAKTGDRERFHVYVTDARSLSQDISVPHRRGEVLSELARTVAQAGEPDLAIAVARDITERYWHDILLEELAESAAEHGDHPLALRFVADVADAYNKAATLTKLAGSAIRSGRYEHAQACLEGITEPYSGTDRGAVLLGEAVAAGDVEHARAFLDVITDPSTRERGIAAMVAAGVAKGDHELAVTFALGLPETAARAKVVAEVAAAADSAGHHARATELFARAWAHAAGIADPRARALTAAAVAVTGGAPARAHLAEAEEIAVANLDGEDLVAALCQLARAAAMTGDRLGTSRLLADAERAIGQVSGDRGREHVRVELLRSAIAAGEHRWASTRLGGVARDARAWLTVELAEAVAGAGALPWAASLVADAEVFVDALRTPDEVVAARTRLATVAVRCGDLERALAVVHGIADEDSRVTALAEVAQDTAAAGDFERALLLVRRVTDVDGQDQTLANLAEVAASTGDYELAREVVASITVPNRAEAQFQLVGSALAAHDWAAAANVVADMASDRKLDALDKLTRAAAAAGEPDLARDLAHDIGLAVQTTEVLTSLAAGTTGDRVLPLLVEAGALAATLPNSVSRARALARVVDVAVAAGERDHAMAVARTITDARHQARAYTRLAVAAAEAGDHVLARDLVVDAEAFARNVRDTALSDVITRLAVAALVAGERERARALARGIGRPGARVRALGELAAVAGQPALARSFLTDALAFAAGELGGLLLVRALAGLVGVADAVGMDDLVSKIIAAAERLTGTVQGVASRASLLVELAQAAAAVGRADVVRRLLADVRTLVGTVDDLERRGRVQAIVAEVAIAAGDLELARMVADGITNYYARHRVWIEVARAASAAGEHELALSVASGIDDTHSKFVALQALVEHAAVSGDRDRARSLALATTDWYDQAQLLTWQIHVATATGDHEWALGLADDISHLHSRNQALAWLVRAAIAAGDHRRAEAIASRLPVSYRDEVEPYLTGRRPAAGDLYSTVSSPGPLLDILVAAGDRETALSVAQVIELPGSKVAELTKLVGAEIAAGNHDRALAVAREITDPAGRAAALAKVVRATGDVARARALLAEVLVLGRWHESVKLVAEIAPEALLPVLDELEARFGGAARGLGRSSG